MVRTRLVGVVLAIGVVLSGALLPLASGGAAPVTVLRVAEAPGANPNYIFPYMQCAYFSSSNINYFQRLMYRPLYWFGLGRGTSLVPSMSLAQPPVFNPNNTTVTISTKGWRFRDGQIVDARSVMFFLNLWASDPTNFCAYEPNHGIPDEIVRATALGNTVRIQFNAPMNPNWLIGSFLNMVTPLPEIWDRTGSALSAGCSTGMFRAPSTIRACKAVDAYLQARAGDTTSFTSPFWQAGTDGPWLLTSFSSAGNATFIANRAYSGSPKPGVQMLREIAYHSTSDILHDLEVGNLDMAFLDYPTLASTGTSSSSTSAVLNVLSKNFSITASAPWSINYFPFNFNPADPKAAVVAQPYIRLAMQYAVDQNSIIRSIYGGYASPGQSPLPVGVAPVISGQVASPATYDLTQARTLLTTHGWSIQNGVMTCVRPGASADSCGSGVAAGTTLALNMIATSDSPQLNQIIALEVSAWRAIGIIVTVQHDAYSAVISACGANSGFELCAWNGGWNFLPNIYPTGEQLFTTGGTFNLGAYSDHALDILIAASLHSKSNLGAYAKFIVDEAPVIFQPTPSLLMETRKSLRSSAPIAPNPLGSFAPEYFQK